MQGRKKFANILINNECLVLYLLLMMNKQINENKSSSGTFEGET